ncbi:MAG: alpha/beta fold hydrolase [Myxococcota bacterium]
MSVPQRACPRPRVAALCVALWVAAAGCAGPAEQALDRGRALGFEVRRVEGAPYPHVLLERPHGDGKAPTFVYLDGDADPARVARRWPFDATPSPPIALDLMAADPGPAVYLGRPGQLGAPAPPRTWTLGRYGEDVVSSLVAALRRAGLTVDGEGVVLVGVSGGGTLAVLMAERLAATEAVVTVAGNLDVAAWTAHRREPPLVDSLDPALRPPLGASLVQLHLLGGRDRTVPPELARGFLERQPGARVRRFPDFDHHCCWASVWPGIAGELRGELARDRPPD